MPFKKCSHQFSHPFPKFCLELNFLQGVTLRKNITGHLRKDQETCSFPDPSAGHTPLLWDPAPASLQTVLTAVAAALSRLLGTNVCLLAGTFWGLYLQNYCIVQDSNMLRAMSFLWAKRRERQKKAHFPVANGFLLP